VQLEYLIACVNANEKIIARQLYKNLITDMLRMFTKTKTLKYRHGTRTDTYFQTSVMLTLTLTFGRVIWHTVMYHPSTSTYIPNFLEIGKNFCEQIDARIIARDRMDNETGFTRSSHKKLGIRGITVQLTVAE